MVDKISSWKFVEDFAEEGEVFRRARMRAEELGVECVTASVGSQLAVLAAATTAKSIIEVGTGTGVSGLWLLGASEDSTLATIDSEPDHLDAARTAFQEAAVKPTRTRIINGFALEVMSNMADAAYDLIFLDGDHETLEQQVREAARLLRPGGSLAIAHALWRDRVPDPAMRDETTVQYREVLKFLKSQADHFVTALSATGDGFLVAVRRG